MFCTNCGREIPDSAKFCRYCGTACCSKDGEPYETTHIPDMDYAYDDDDRAMKDTSSGLTCPYCGATNSQLVTRTTTHTQAGGYSYTAGICGGILLGPLGLLLGLCGRSASATTATKSRWVCMNCGAEFISPQDAKQVINGLAVLGTLFTQATVFLVPLCLSEPDFLWIFCVLAACAAISWIACMYNKTGYRLEEIMTDFELDKWKKTCIFVNVGIMVGIILFWLTILN